MAASATLAATLYQDEGDTRRSARREVGQASTLRDPSLRPVNVLVHDLSVHGLRLSCPAELEPDSVVRIGLPAVGQVQVRIIRRDGDDYGCAFLQPISERALANAFRGERVVPIGVVPLPAQRDASPDPEIEPWSVGLRLGFILGAASVLWAAVIIPLVLLY